MAVGRRPLPTALKVVRGNPGKHALNRREPVPAVLDPQCPDELTHPVARIEWDRIVPGLIACGIATAADRLLLIVYCATWAQWLTFHQSGQLTKAASAYGRLLRAMGELGLTPAARSRVHAVPPSTGSTWADVLK